METIYKPEDMILQNSSPSTIKNYGIIVLEEITLPPQIMIPLWNKAKTRTAIGTSGKNWQTYIKKHDIKNTKLINVYNISVVTTCVVPNRKTKIKNMLGNLWRCTTEQNDSQFDKRATIFDCICETYDHSAVDYIFVVKGKSGRFHKTLEDISIINGSLISSVFNDVTIVFISDEVIYWTVKAGKSVIEIPDALRNNGEVECGIYPIGGPASSIVTSGLWNNISANEKVDGGCHALDGSKTVTIESQAPILWIIDIHPLMKKSM